MWVRNRMQENAEREVKAFSTDFERRTPNLTALKGTTARKEPGAAPRREGTAQGPEHPGGSRAAGAAAPACRVRGGDGRCLVNAKPDIEALDRMLTRLKLTAIRDGLDRPLDEVARSELTLRESLAFLCEAEVARKDERRIQMASSIAKFPF